MQMQFIRLMLSPGDEENEIASANEPTPAKDTETDETAATGEVEEEPFIEKVKDALQDWSNQDQADQDFDDTRV